MFYGQLKVQRAGSECWHWASHIRDSKDRYPIGYRGAQDGSKRGVACLPKNICRLVIIRLDSNYDPRRLDRTKETLGTIKIPNRNYLLMTSLTSVKESILKGIPANFIYIKSN